MAPVCSIASRSIDGKTMMSKSRVQELLQNTSHYLLGAGAAGLMCSMAVVAVAADSPKANNAIPPLMQEPGVAWRAYLFGGRTQPPRPAQIPHDPTAHENPPP